jgi:pyrimidine-specific ribonucleoside hydrolase
MVVDLQPNLQTLPVILDTEIGGEPDDAMALVIAARELPELALVITSDELGGQRARFARYLLDSAGRADVAVVAGHQLSETPPYFADGLVPDWVAPASTDVARAVAQVCARSGGVARWIGLGPLSNLAALLATDPGLGRRLFVTQLTGTWSGSGQALPPRNFRLDPAAARQVLAHARHLRLVNYALPAGQQAQLTATSPAIRQLTDAAPSWAGVLAAHCGQFFARYHPEVIPGGPLALAAALRVRFTPFGPARVSVGETGWITAGHAGAPGIPDLGSPDLGIPDLGIPDPGIPNPVTPAPRTAVTTARPAVDSADPGSNVLISRDIDYQALTDWLSARLKPGVWTQWARQPGAGRSSLVTRTNRAGWPARAVHA